MPAASGDKLQGKCCFPPGSRWLAGLARTNPPFLQISSTFPFTSTISVPLPFLAPGKKTTPTPFKRFPGSSREDARVMQHLHTHTHTHFQPLIYTELPGKSTAQQTSSGSSRAAGVSQRSSRGTGQEGESSVSCTHSHPMLFVRTLPAWWGRQQEHQACTWGRIQHGGAQQGPGAAIGGSALPSGCRGSAGAAARFGVCKVKREALKLFQDNFLFQTEAP